MTKSFAIHIFYPDGDSPESGKQKMKSLSKRWLTVCSDMLSHYGPVMDHNMGSTLSHFDIKMDGPVGQLSAYGYKCFDFAISLGANSDQDRAAAQYFRNLLQQVVDAAGVSLRGDTVAVLDEAPSHPGLLLFDGGTPEVDDDQKGALMQLGFHLAGAYFQYCEAKLKHR